MADLVWELNPRTGIAFIEIAITFGMERADVQVLLSKYFLAPSIDNSYPNEDDFLTSDQSSFIRIRYDGTLVQDIEFLSGKLQYQGINLHSNTTFSEIEACFILKGLEFRDTQWLGDGQDCEKLGINIATRENVGGDEGDDEIEWVILSKRFD